MIRGRGRRPSTSRVRASSRVKSMKSSNSISRVFSVLKRALRSGRRRISTKRALEHGVGGGGAGHLVAAVVLQALDHLVGDEHRRARLQGHVLERGYGDGVDAGEAGWFDRAHGVSGTTGEQQDGGGNQGGGPGKDAMEKHERS